MTQDYPKPIAPPPELTQQWDTEGRHQDYCTVTEHIAARAAQWGWDQREPEIQAAADQELEACLAEINTWGAITAYGGALADDLRAARRPKPPSLKEQALEDLESLIADLANHGMGFKATNIRRALEALSDD
jgi:hypothetical protein